MSPQAALAALRQQWRGLQPRQRQVVLGAGVGVLALLLVWAGLAARGPAMAPLFTQLRPQDGAAILAQLQQRHIPYRVTQGGSSILVPQAQVDALRLELAGAGLPAQGGVGLGTVLNLPFGATNFTRRIAYQQALQQELADTIESIQGVQSARVQIVLPQTTAFGVGGAPASAAVLLNLQPGVTLSPQQVAGVVHLVASSVQGLQPSNVTVLDQSGQILLPATSASGVGLGGSGTASAAQANLAVQQQFDQQVQQGLQQMLDQVFGPGNAVAAVHAQLSFQSGTVQRQQFDPGHSRAVVQSLQRVQQSETGPVGPLAPVGTSSNSFPPTYRATGGGSGKATLNQLTENFAVSQVDQNLHIAPGQLTGLSVAVVLNGNLGPARLAQVRQMVMAAVGASPQDQVTVVAMPFSRSLLKQLQQPSLPVPQPLTRVLLAVAGLAVLALLVLLMRRRRRAPEVAPLPPAADEMAANGHGPALPWEALLRARQGSEQDAQTEAMRRQRPEDIAQIIRIWLNEDV